MAHCGNQFGNVEPQSYNSIVTRLFCFRSNQSVEKSPPREPIAVLIDEFEMSFIIQIKYNYQVKRG